MKLHRLNEELEPQAPEGTVLIAWKTGSKEVRYDGYSDIQYANYEKNIRSALGPLIDIPRAKQILISLNTSRNWKRNPKYIYMRDFYSRKRNEKVMLKEKGNLLVVDTKTLLDKFSKLLYPGRS